MVFVGLFFYIINFYYLYKYKYNQLKTIKMVENNQKWQVKNNGSYLEIRDNNPGDNKINSISIFCYDVKQGELNTNFNDSEELANGIAEFLNNKKTII